MYSLRVFYGDGPSARAVHTAAKGEDAIKMIRDLLTQHEGCERVEIHMGSAKLFAVDCNGQRISD